MAELVDMVGQAGEVVEATVVVAVEVLVLEELMVVDMEVVVEKVEVLVAELEAMVVVLVAALAVAAAMLQVVHMQVVMEVVAAVGKVAAMVAMLRENKICVFNGLKRIPPLTRIKIKKNNCTSKRMSTIYKHITDANCMLLKVVLPV